MIRNKTDIKFNILLIVLFIALTASLLSGISLGAVRISLKDTYSTIQSNLFHVNAASLSKSTMAIVWNIRIPRVIMGLIAGVGLALCGTVMQTTVNNPISEPYILGISAGATFGATFFIILGGEIKYEGIPRQTVTENSMKDVYGVNCKISWSDDNQAMIEYI